MNEQTVSLVSVKYFKDGNFAVELAALGYPAEWKANERRTIPVDLARRLKQSGALFTFPDGSERESKLTVSGPSVQVSEAEAEQIASQRQQGERKQRVIFLANFRDGTLAAEFAALGHPPEVRKFEIITLPSSLLEKCLSSGARVSDRSEEIQLYELRQGKFVVINEAWQRERTASQARDEAAQDAASHNQQVMARIETISARLLKATNKNTKTQLSQELESLWAQVR